MSSSRSLFVFSSLTATLAHGQLFYTYTYDEHPLYSRSSWADAPEYTMARSNWRMSPEYYSTKIQTPAIEEGSVSASLSPDGTMLNVQAKRYIEGCQCQESTVGQVRLPHTPRVEDIDLTHNQKTGVVSVKVARHAKADEPTPVTIKTLEPEPKPVSSSPGKEGRPLRFVPHESAVLKQEDGIETDKKHLLDKFRAVSATVAAVNELQKAKAGVVKEPQEKKNETFTDGSDNTTFLNTEP